MKVAIRTDASAVIGSGHVMRCLCLADALAARGAKVHFVSRALPGHLHALVTGRGHSLATLPGLAAGANQGSATAEAIWPAPMREQDARDTLMALSSEGTFDWLVVDHYAAGEAWETAMKPLASRRMAIDDLGRRHDCELLLDQNFYPVDESPYGGKLPSGCRSLVGPAFALLRPEFRAAHERAQARDGAVDRVLVFLGGMDAANVTRTAVRALLAMGKALPAIDVVIGAAHPARSDIESLCAGLERAQCHVQTSDMAGLCARADLAIGAGGSATWERCAVGLPAVVLAVAENQREITRNAARAGLLYAPDEYLPNEEALAIHLRAVMESSGLRNFISGRGLATVDGLGCERVAREMLLQ